MHPRLVRFPPPSRPLGPCSLLRHAFAAPSGPARAGHRACPQNPLWAAFTATRQVPQAVRGTRQVHGHREPRVGRKEPVCRISVPRVSAHSLPHPSLIRVKCPRLPHPSQVPTPPSSELSAHASLIRVECPRLPHLSLASVDGQEASRTALRIPFTVGGGQGGRGGDRARVGFAGVAARAAGRRRPLGGRETRGIYALRSTSTLYVASTLSRERTSRGGAD